MPTPPLSKEQLRAAADAYRKQGVKGYSLIGISAKAFESRVTRAIEHGYVTRAERGLGGPSPHSPDTGPLNDVGALADQVRSLRAMLKSKEREDLTEDYVKREILKLSEATINAEPPTWLSQPPKKGKTIGVPTLFASDWHFGEVVFPAQVNHVNEFNLEIAHARARRMIETACSLLLDHMVSPNYAGIVLALGGDMMSGDIHEELSESNEKPAMPVLLDLFDVLRPAIRHLADRFGKVFAPCVAGNHGRNTRKPRAKNRAFSNFDWLLYQMLAREFESDPRVTFYIPDGSDAHYSIYGHRYCLTHGDQFRGGDGMIGALGPIIRGDHKKRSRNGQIDLGYDTLLLGHWHQLIELQRLIVNGSLKGYDEYAAQNNFGFEPPQQACWITHPDHGITMRMPVKLESSRRGVETEWLKWAA